METMEALWLKEQKIRFRNDVQIPVPLKNEALIHVSVAGICATDLEMIKGYLPYTGIPGHEFVGVVTETPPGEEAWIGKRVVGEINAACESCKQCLAGRRTHCEKRTVLGILNRNGAFAEFLTLPLENLHRVPETIEDETAVFTEPLAAALEVQQQVHVRPDDRVLIIGAGRLGQLIAQTLSLKGCEINVVVRHEKQGMILKRHGIAILQEKDVPERERDIVIEASGSPTGFFLALKAVRPGGTIVYKSTYRGELKADFSPIAVNEISIIGSRCGPFAPALRLLENKDIDPTVLIEAYYPLSEGIKALKHALKSGTLKVLLRTRKRALHIKK
jgi:threonine dehydrogenase-like Zn-dependent dehydrogenase